MNLESSFSGGWRCDDLVPVAAAVASLVVPLIMFAPTSAEAFCGSYVSGGSSNLFNNATQVVMMRHKQTTVLSMQNNYEGPPKDFAMIVPTPEVLQKDNVKTIEDGVFDRVDTLTAPRLVEYWEKDPCGGRYRDGVGGSASGGAAGSVADAGAAADGGGGNVSVEARFSKGEYEIVILKSDESTALEQWLRDRNYNIPQGASAYLKPYIQQGSYFFVAKVDTQKVQFENGQAVLSPLRFNYESPDFKLPVRLGLINSKGKQDLIVNILAQDQRYKVANYPHATIPTNIEVVSKVKNYFATFYRELFKRTLKRHRANGKNPVITEYAWSAGSCDPCPTGTVSTDDLYTLGVDVMSEKYGSGGDTGGDAGAARPSYEFRRGWVITRLHTRYGKNELGADLVFEEAGPIVGGRESVRNENGELSQEARSASRNNFQGRYIIRHKWDGPVDCENPEFGRWGGRSGGGSPSPQTAKGQTNREGDTESKENVELEKEVRANIESIGLTAQPSEEDDDVHWDGPGGTASDGGGCSLAPGGSPAIPWSLLFGVGLLIGMRRRRD